MHLVYPPKLKWKTKIMQFFFFWGGEGGGKKGVLWSMWNWWIWVSDETALSESLETPLEEIFYPWEKTWNGEFRWKWITVKWLQKYIRKIIFICLAHHVHQFWKFSSWTKNNKDTTQARIMNKYWPISSKRALKAQASSAQGLGAGSPRNFFGFKLLKVPFHRFPSHSNRLLARFQLGKCFYY